MVTPELKIDLTNLKRKNFQMLIRNLISEAGHAYTELTDFWNRFESNGNEITENTLVFLDLNRLYYHLNKTGRRYWAYRVRKDNVYFVLLIRTRSDETFVPRIADLTSLIGNRITVFRVKSLKGGAAVNARKELSAGLSRIIARNFDPDALKTIAYNRHEKSFLVEFNDKTNGKVTLDELNLGDMEDKLMLDQPVIGEFGDAAEFFTLNGDLYEIDALVIKSFLSDQSKTTIRQHAELTARQIGEKIKTARKAAGRTQVQLSELTGMDQAIISKIENGRHIPHFTSLERMASGLQISVNRLLGVE